MNGFCKRGLFWFATGVALAGCGGSSGGGGLPNPDLRYINAISDSTAIDFTLNTTVEAASQAYEATTANFLRINPGDYDDLIQEHGNQVILWDQSDTFVLGSDYIVCAYGEENFGSEPLKRPLINAFKIDRSVPNGTKSRLYVMHAFNLATGFETPGIDFQNPGLNPKFKVADIGYGAADPIEVDSGSEEFQALRTGTQEVFIDKVFNLAAGHVYVVLVTGINGAAGAQAPDMKLYDIQTKT